jgi:NAD(P)-dependent dehydrogenase (short-subunit alcohol dehydrogenase family)
MILAIQGFVVAKLIHKCLTSGESVEEIKNEAMAAQSIKRLVDPRDIAALAVFLASDAGKSISGQMLPIDNDMQKAS